jgi:hypothetical protein
MDNALNSTLVIPLMVGLFVALVAAFGVWVFRRNARLAAGGGHRPGAGEIWWADVPFRDTDEQKTRPCLVLRAQGGRIQVLKITSQDKSHRDDHVQIPTRAWDRSAAYDSFLDLSSPIPVAPRAFRNLAGTVDAVTWARVRARHAVDEPRPAGAVARQPVTSAAALWGVLLAWAGLLTCGATAPFGALLGHLARADIRHGRAYGDRRATKAIVVGWSLTAVMGMGWYCAAGSALSPDLDIASQLSGQTRLVDLPGTAKSGGAAGVSFKAEMGGGSYPRSLGVWVGCDGTPAVAVYQLGGKYKKLEAVAGLAGHAPDGLTAKITFSADGRRLAAVTVTKKITENIAFDVTGVKTLEVSAVRAKGTCGRSDTPYAALGDGLLSP